MTIFSGSYLAYVLPAILLSMLAQWLVTSTYGRWSKVRNHLQLTGADAAQRLLTYGGLHEVNVEAAPGKLSDHYDPRSRTLRLSASVAQSPSVAALAVAAHEIGHALQDRQGYLPLRLRSALVPAVNLGSSLAWILILIGFMLRNLQLATLGVVAFAVGAVFALATLPVELNASARARTLLRESGLVQGAEEAGGVNAVLSAAAFTYVAALAAAVLQLLYFTGLLGGMGRRR
jgi:Zn-dependent membrane protease YugP